MAADVFMGHDENCVARITVTRVLEPEVDGDGRASRRWRWEKRRSRRGETD